ncbi:unnamed protein product, partial [Staurois parvus]
CQWEESCPSLVNSTPSVGRGIVPHHWCQREEYRPIIGVSGRNSAPSLVSVGGIAPHHWCQWGNSAPYWCQWEE